MRVVLENIKKFAIFKNTILCYNFLASEKLDKK